VTSLIQVIPGLIVVYWLVRREWRILAGVFATIILSVSLMLIVTGPRSLAEWAIAHQRWFMLLQTPMNASPQIQLGQWASLILAVLYLFVLVFRKPQSHIAYLWTIITMLWLSPIVWIYFLTWLLPILWFWWTTNHRWLSVAGYMIASAATLAEAIALHTRYVSFAAPAVILGLLFGMWLTLGYGCSKNAQLPRKVIADSALLRSTTPAPVPTATRPGG
jgi:hypothetical protein